MLQWKKSDSCKKSDVASLIYKQWVEVETKTFKKLQMVHKHCFVGEILDEFQSDFNITAIHVNIKRIQSNEFQADIADPKKRVVQIDYAMAYQCISK